MNAKQNILIIDDDSENIKIVVNIIRNEDIVILAAINGKVGIEIAKKRVPDLILLDIQMPEMDGFDVCRILKNDKATKDIPIIFMTARTDEESIEEAFDLGGVDYITKPIKRKELLARVKTHSSLSQKIKELQELNTIKNTLFSVISHDLRGPIGSLNYLFNEFENLDSLSIDDKRDILRAVKNSVQNISKILNNLLDWARIQKNEVLFNPKKCSINDCITESINFLNHSAEEKKVELKFAEEERIFVLGDENMIKTILRNIISNAIKYTKMSGKIEIYATINESFAEVKICDNGIGMNNYRVAELLSNKVNSSEYGTNGEKGTGIGFAVSMGFVEKNNGKISIESELGKGSKFVISLPIYK